MILLYIASALALVTMLATVPETMMVYPRWASNLLDTVAAWSWVLWFCGIATVLHQSL